MTESVTAFTGARVFDGTEMHGGMAVLTRGEVFAGLVPEPAIPASAAVVRLEGGYLAPGFVDLQVNGGGGLMFNDDPSVETLSRIAGAHAGLGTTTLLPTLITDTPETTEAAIGAVRQAMSSGVPGIGGLHLEGPHLAVDRKGAHAPELIRSMESGDVQLYCNAARELPVLMLTLAPEVVSCARITTLAEAGVLISLGHSNCDFDTARDAAESGARVVTHLFNAMSQLGSRAPGLVGAALTQGRLSAGLIADGMHVHPDTMRAALSAKNGPGRIFLVSDAMAVAGTDLDGFVLNGRTVRRSGGRLTLEDGTLAGADLTLAEAVRRIAVLTGDVASALEMATSVPARLAGLDNICGHIRENRPADMLWLDDDLTLKTVWQAGAARPGLR